MKLRRRGDAPTTEPADSASSSAAATASGESPTATAGDSDRVGTAAPDGDGALAVDEWLKDEADVEVLEDLLHEVIDPELGVNIVDLGLIYNVRVSDRVALIRMTLTTPGCPLSDYMDESIHRVLWGAPGVDDVDVTIVFDPPWDPNMMTDLAKGQLGWYR